MTGFIFAEQQLRIARCPHCGTGRPQVTRYSIFSGGGQQWALYAATCCGRFVLAQGKQEPPGLIETIYPDIRSAAIEIPEPARRYLQQALDTLNAPDAAAVMAGSAVDAMLKHFGLIEGSVYQRIEQAVKSHLLTEAMGEWAHEVRLGANRPRHADAENPHVSTAQARQSVEFAEALGQFLFVLSSRVNKGIEAAKEVEASDAAPGSTAGVA